MDKKLIKKTLALLASPFMLGLIVAVAVASIARSFYASYGQPGGSQLTKLLTLVHEKTIDWRLKARGPMAGHPDVAVLTIDERAIEQEGRWPWPRERTARVLDRAFERGAKLIAFDMVFSEADPNSSLPTLQRIKRRLGERQQLTPEAQELFRAESASANSDFAFAETIARHADQLVMGSYFDTAAREAASPFADACVGALFESDPAFDYLHKEKIQLFVDDASQIQLPGPIKDRLIAEITERQADVASEWLAKRPAALKTLIDAFAAERAQIDDRVVAKLIAFWLQKGNNGDVEFQAALPANFPEMKDPESPPRLLEAVKRQIAPHEQLLLSTDMNDLAQRFCGRMLTARDPLMTFEARQAEIAPSASREAALKDWRENLSWQVAWPEAQKSNPALAGLTLEQWAQKTGANAAPNMIEPVDRFWINIPMLGASTSHTGYFNAFLDSDGSLRKSRLVAHRGSVYAPSLALKAFLLARKYSAALELGNEGGGFLSHPLEKVAKRLGILDASGSKVMDIPVDDSASIVINYAGPRASFPHVSAADILSDSKTLRIERLEQDKNGRWRSSPTAETVDKDEFLKGKMLVFGATAIGIYDLRVTPFEENYPGVETHANVLSNLLVAEAMALAKSKAQGGAGDPTLEKGAQAVLAKTQLGFMRTDPREPQAMIAAVLALGIVMSALLAWLSSLPGLGVTVAAVALLGAIDKYFIFKSGIVIAAMFPLMAILGVFVTLTFYKYFTEERTKRELKGTFEKYVSPAIVAEVLADPSNIELGGKKMELTVMFSDVRGFTTISEKLDPRALSDLLNSYLTPMTDLVFEHKGTLDKYMGDAVMAFWGAPIHFPDHAKHAARCALAMLVKLKQLQAEYRAKGLPEIDIGIGLNTGEMSVGNMGSNTVRSYTVMGDAVNLGSRLEGINKDYGTRIIVSEFTQRVIADEFITREVDWVRVKGKKEPVRIFELIAEKAGAAAGETASNAEFIARFDEGFALYHERKFAPALAAFRRARELKPADKSVEEYVSRCEDYVAEPPPADRDGVVTKKTK